MITDTTPNTSTDVMSLQDGNQEPRAPARPGQVAVTALVAEER